MTDLVRRLLAAAALAVLAGSLAACGGIPSSGSVHAGDPFTEEPAGDFVFTPVGPAAGADQRGILEGFIAAFTGPQSDYQVAREFLSSQFKKEWEPRKSVLIRTGIPSFSSVSPSIMEYSFTNKAQVDEFGAYTVVAPAVQTLEFQFVKEGGEWRISQAPAGIVLPESTFLTIFSKHALYFYDLSLRHLVPDERWFPGGATATRIVAALLAGPPQWLRGAVVSQFPDGAQLTPGTTVTVDSTIAQIDLTAEAAGADERQRQLMQLQLSESLSSVSGIAGVQLSVSGSLLAIPPLGIDGSLTQRSVDSRPLVLAGGEFGYLSAGEITPLEQLSEKIVDLEPLAVTLGSLGTAAAVLGPDGVSAARSGPIPVQVLDERPGLIAPSIDDFGYIWSVPADDPAGIVAFDFDGTPHPVAATLPAEARVVSLDVAQDNSRVAMLLQTPVGPRLLVMAILRDPAQGYVPTGLGVPVMDVVGDPGIALDATWVDRFSVAVLTETEGSSLVTSYEVGGQQTSLGRPGPAIAIVGGNGGSTGLRVLGSDHLLQSPRGSSWQEGSIEVELIATQR